MSFRTQKEARKYRDTPPFSDRNWLLQMSALMTALGPVRNLEFLPFSLISDPQTTDHSENSTMRIDTQAEDSLLIPQIRPSIHPYPQGISWGLIKNDALRDDVDGATVCCVQYLLLY